MKGATDCHLFIWASMEGSMKGLTRTMAPEDGLDDNLGTTGP